VKTDDLGPVSGGQQVTPGFYPPGTLPDPTELVCIFVDKVYDACSQRHCFEDIKFVFWGKCEPTDSRSR